MNADFGTPAERLRDALIWLRRLRPISGTPWYL